MSDERRITDGSVRRNRTAFAILIGIASLTVLVPASNALARMACSPPNAAGVSECVAGIKFTDVVAVAARQQQTEWCWAATISMLFAYHGHPKSQEEIVQFAYRGLVNMPGQPFQLTSALNRTWSDDDNQSFSVSAKTFDLQDRIATINTSDIIQSLSESNPVVIGAEGHAMLLTAVKFLRWPGVAVGPITYAGVLDPWTGTARQLDPSHSIAQYAAVVTVTDAGRSTTSRKGKTSGGQDEEQTVDKCQKRYDACIQDVRSVDDCIEQDFPQKCIDTCVEMYNHSNAECAAIYCQATPTNLAGWRSSCGRSVRKDKEKCTDERTECRDVSSD